MKKIALLLGTIFGICNAMDLPKADPSKSIILELQKACAKGDAGKVAHLMRIAKIDSSLNAEGFNFMHYAAVSGSPETVQLLLDANPKLIDVVDRRGNIPFSHLFLVIYQWREGVAREVQIMESMHNFLPSLLQYSGPSRTFEEHVREQVSKRVALSKKIIDIFVSRGANLEIANVCGKKWVDIPGLDEELGNYAKEQINKRKNS